MGETVRQVVVEVSAAEVETEEVEDMASALFVESKEG